VGEFFDDLKEGLEEILAYKQGKITLKSELIEVPEPPCQYSAKDIKRIRGECNYSQSLFAIFLNVSVKTVQAWESGERVPNHAALRLLELVDEKVYCPPSSQRHAENLMKTGLKTKTARRRKSRRKQHA
jgi:putative transcriptional regulator